MAYDETKVVNVKALKDTATRIKTEYLVAISKAGHARFQKSDTVPDAGTAEENVLYLVHNDETGHYDVYALIDGVVELLDDTTVSLDGYVTDDDLAEALNGVTEHDEARVNPDPASVAVMVACGFCPTCEMLDGKIRFRALQVPASAISVRYRIQQGKE